MAIHGGIAWLLVNTEAWMVVLACFVVVYSIPGLINIVTRWPVPPGVITSLGYFYGDLSLIVIVLIEQAVLKRPGTYGKVWAWVFMTPVSFAVFCLSFGSGLIFLVKSRPWRGAVPSEHYHDLMIIPFFCLLLFPFVLVIVLAGTWAEFWIALVLGLFWMSTSWYDFKSGRMNQRRWLAELGRKLE